MIKSTGEEDGCCSCVLHGMKGIFQQVKEQDLPVLKVGYNEGQSKRLVYRKHKQDLGDVEKEVAVKLECDSATRQRKEQSEN